MAPPAVFVRILFAVLFGLLLAPHLPDSWFHYMMVWYLIIALLSFVALRIHLFYAIGYRKYSGLLLLLSISITSLCSWHTSAVFTQLPSDLNGQEVVLFGRSVTSSETYASGVKLTLSELRITNGDTVIDVPSGKVLLYVKDQHRRDWVGKEVVARGRWASLSKALNPEQFDYGEYLSKQGVVGQVFSAVEDVESKRFSAQQPIQWIGMALERMRLVGIQRFQQNEYFTIEDKGLFIALCLGDRSEIHENTEESFVSAGIIHVLAVSGLHVGIIYLVVSALFTKVLPGARWQWMRLLLILAVLWGYAGITGFSPSVLRASVMFSFIVLGKEWRKNSNIYNSISASALVLLIINPQLLFTPGFQLSYAAVLGIVAFYPILNNLWVPKHFLLEKAWSLFCVSMVAQLATLPFTLYYFQQFPTYFWIANVLILPLIPVLLSGGLLYLPISLIPFVGEAVGFVLHYLSFITLRVASFISMLPHAVQYPIYINIGQFIALLSAVCLLVWYTQKRKNRMLFAALFLFAIMPFWSVLSRSLRAGETEVVLYASRKPLYSFRNGDIAVVVGDVKAQFDYMSHLNSCYISELILIPESCDTIIPKAFFEKEGQVIRFLDRFYALHHKAKPNYYYQLAPYTKNAQPLAAELLYSQNSRLPMVRNLSSQGALVLKLH